ncbi:hypothetical protein ACH61_01171 [Rathayibacter tanaceti]|uniref:Uncharacterized protein n=1 Tax=Rathayibacter tanaceti TaxID=1671680 RepID=A0A166I5X9_9MICO|nr:hypothetical protein ACH61_01171 [Rathayibacter tanaceti]
MRSWTLGPDEGQTLLVYEPAPGTPHEDAIRLLATWQVTPAGIPADTDHCPRKAQIPEMDGTMKHRAFEGCARRHRSDQD